MSYPEDIKKIIQDNFERFGINKKNEIARLLYEIGKRSKKKPEDILEFSEKELQNIRFEKLKNFLLKKRYPEEYKKKKVPKDFFYLPKLKLNRDFKVKIKDENYYPSKIYFEEEVKKTDLFKKAKKNFPKSDFNSIDSVRELQKEADYSLSSYNSRRDSLILVNQEYDLIKRCPCTQDCTNCGYNIFNLGFGCPYECTYCYLQSYTNAPGIIVPANIEDFFNAVEKNSKKLSGKRIGSGEFSDSLALDPFTGYSKDIIEFFREYPEIIFEFKTKSDNVENILKTPPSDNIVIAWSLNPQKFIDHNEFYSASLENRLDAASRCVESGYNVAFHFDPVVPYRGYKNDYREVVDELFDKVDGDMIRWISLGSFRFPRELKRTIENRFPKNSILDGELLIGFDGKLRYSTEKRKEIYKNIKNYIRKRSNKPAVYLCMEPPEIWRDVGLNPVSNW